MVFTLKRFTVRYKWKTESSTEYSIFEYNKFLDMQSSFVGGTVVWTYVKHLINDLFLSDENKTITKQKPLEETKTVMKCIHTFVKE